MYFMIYSFLGRCLEVIYHGVSKGIVVNGGFLNGPVCPIYGVTMICIFAMVQDIPCQVVGLQKQALQRYQELEKRQQELRDYLLKKANHHKVAGIGHLLRAFPDMEHRDYPEIFTALKSHVKATGKTTEQIRLKGPGRRPGTPQRNSGSEI